MSYCTSILRVLPILAAPVLLSGCVAAVIAGGVAAGAGGGYAASQERGLNGSVDDFEIKTNIESAWQQADPDLQGHLTVTIYQGRALLTGTVPNPAMKEQARQIAAKANGIRALYDEIEVAPDLGQWDDAKDAWITTRLRSALVFDPDVRSVNYTIETANHSVYLIGSGRSQHEIDRATDLARNIPGVRRVVSYVDIRPGAPGGAPGGAQPPQTAQPAPRSGPDVPVAAPRTPVQEERL
jgi:osmotically-inducible protein OsmY